VVGTTLHQFSVLSVPRFCRGKWLEVFFISSLVCLHQGSLEEVVGTILHQFFYGLSLKDFEEGRGTMAGTLLHDSSDLVCPKL
jgi:hypothetical protein